MSANTPYKTPSSPNPAIYQLKSTKNLDFWSINTLLSHLPPTRINQIQSRLLKLATGFLLVYSLAVTLSPILRARAWQANLHWEVWIGFIAWLVITNIAHQQSDHWLPDRDPYLLPVAAFLSGWGLLTVWRLNPDLGWRQTAWMIAAVGLLTAGLRLPSQLLFLRKFKYLWLTSGLLLTGLTFIFGTNPLGYGPRLWLGCCGLYIQPSEPLKFLLVAYLAAYLADQQANLVFFASSTTNKKADLIPKSLITILAPALMMSGIAIGLLLFQRDLGTAAIFLFLFATLIYLSSGQPSILYIACLVLLLAGILGWGLFDVIQIRINAWLNPWIDPSGRSYQVVQALIAIANGGLLGSGPGLGNPNLVPVAHSDFVFSAITEEMGLLGALSILVLLALIANRGIRTAYHAKYPYQRLLAAGLTAYLVGQSILIIGGNIRLFPLTGVTLPFISSGGSSLMTSYLSLMVLLLISNQPEEQVVPRLKTRPYQNLFSLLIGLLALAGLVTSWWAVIRSENLLNRVDNQRRTIADRYVNRGAIVDRNYQAIVKNSIENGEYSRQVQYPQLSSIVGYLHPTYGQSGLEANLDNYLRGLKGNPTYLVIWEQFLYRQPPAGRDIQISLDLQLQKVVDQQLDNHTGAIVVLNAHTGEILSMASHPTYDANQLDLNWNQLVTDQKSPLLNRATQGLYPVGSALGPVLFADLVSQGKAVAISEQRNLVIDEIYMSCASSPTQLTLTEVIMLGCPNPVLAMGESLGEDELARLLTSLGFYQEPGIELPAAYLEAPEKPFGPATLLFKKLRASPLQMALAIAPLSDQGNLPAARLVNAVNVFEKGWVLFPETRQAQPVFTATAASLVQATLLVDQASIWQASAVIPNGADHSVTWYLAGTVGNNLDLPVVLAVLIEEDHPELAASMGRAILAQIRQPDR